MRNCEIPYGHYTNSELTAPLSVWEFANLFWPEYTRKGISSSFAQMVAEKNAKIYRLHSPIVQGRMIPNVRR